jgi:CRISPR-associated endonuclease/helicase Cas3
VLLPTYADLWSQTSPIPNADPDVALFLHGARQSPAGVQIVWRADIHQEDIRSDEESLERLIGLLELVPPRASEAIEIPISAARAWLNRAEPIDFSDSIERQNQAADQTRRPRPAFRWVGSTDERSRAITPAEIRPGDLLVVPAEYGGCDEWGWNADLPTPVIDVADRAQWLYRRRRFAVRVTPELIAQGLKQTAVEDQHYDQNWSAGALDNLLRLKLAEHMDDRSSDLLDAVLEIQALPPQIRNQLNAIKQQKKKLSHEFAYGFDGEERPRGIVFAALRGLKVSLPQGVDPAEITSLPTTESEELGSVSDGPVALITHCLDVCDFANDFAVRAGLSPTVRRDLKWAALLHDAGKADRRYQAYYMGGDPYGPDVSEVLAKSGQKLLPRGAWERANLPPHWRHEALSVRLAIGHPEFKDASDPELVLWLIGTHHGWGRPLFPHADPEDSELRAGLFKPYSLDIDLMPGAGPQSFAFHFGARDWPQIFEELKRRYGMWGLARLEAFIRLADHRASERVYDSGEPLREAAE